MSVPFPYTTNGVGAGFGRIVVSRSALRNVTYVGIPQARTGDDWSFDARLERDKNTFVAIMSALNSLHAGKTIFVSMTDVPLDFSLSGASCGLAAYLAILGVVTDVAVTGYVVTFGECSASMQVQAIDQVDAKIAYAQRVGRKLIVPTKCESSLLRDALARNIITTYFDLAYGMVFDIGAVDSVADLAFVLHAMDRTVAIDLFMPKRLSEMVVRKRL